MSIFNLIVEASLVFNIITAIRNKNTSAILGWLCATLFWLAIPSIGI